MKKRKIKLSIIIVNYNSYNFLKKCLGAFKNQNKTNYTYEIIVVDNASTDRPRLEIAKKFPKIRLINNENNIGFAKANNQAIKKSAGEYILLLNPDTQVDPKSLNKLILHLDAHPEAGIVTGRVELPDGTLDDACHRGFPTPINSFFHFTYLDRLFPYNRFFNGYHLGYKDIDKVHEIDSCVGAAMMIRRSTGKSLNWLDEDYFWYGEDLDFCYRARKVGWKVMFIPDVKIIHYKGISSGIKKHSRGLSSASKYTKLMATKSRYQVMRLFYRKHYTAIYPRWIYKLVMVGINVKEIISSLLIKLNN